MSGRNFLNHENSYIPILGAVLFFGYAGIAYLFSWLGFDILQSDALGYWKTEMKKAEVVDGLGSVLMEKIKSAESAIASTKTSRDSDTKSSAGDKHEVGREMAQQELDAQNAQVAKTKELLHLLSTVDLRSRHDQIAFGSLIHTDQGVYFICIGTGQFKMKGGTVFCISLASPIGQLLMGRRVGETIELNGRKMTVEVIE